MEKHENENAEQGGNGITKDENSDSGPNDSGFVDGTGNENEDGTNTNPKKLQFTRELRCMMHAFGDDPNPFTETVEMLEGIVMKFIMETSELAMKVTKSDKITVESLSYCFRRDSALYERLVDLVNEQRNLKQFRRAFDSSKF